MKITDIGEIKGMWKRENLSCDRFAACYIDTVNGGISMQESKALLSLPETQINKHIAMVKKMMVRDIDGKIIQVPFKKSVPEMLDEVRDCRTSNEDIMMDFYDRIQSDFHYEGNYVILVYHVVYDIPEKGTDGKNQEESEKVYEHLICLICPTKLTKINLSVVNGKIDLTVPDRVISAPVTGFIWPAFDNRSEDRDAMIIYNADESKPERRMQMKVFGIKDYRTTAEIRGAMKSIFEDVIKTEELAERHLKAVTTKLGDMSLEKEVTGEDFRQILQGAGVPETYLLTLKERFEYRIAEFHPKAYQLMHPDYIASATDSKKGTKMRNLLLRAAGVIEDVQGTESELVRDLLTAADMQEGGRDERENERTGA